MESYKSEGRASRAHRCHSSPMRLLRFAFVFVIAGLSLSAARGVLNANARETSSPHPDDSVSAFLGRWDLTLKAPDREYPSWLELSQEHGQLKAQMVGHTETGIATVVRDFLPARMRGDDIRKFAGLWNAPDTLSR